MSRRVARQRKIKPQVVCAKRIGKRLAVACSLLALLLSVGVMAKWKLLPGFSHPSTPSPAPPGNFNANRPSKEYIYAGGRLVATEEPVALPAPTSFSASTISSAQINLSWIAQGTADHYLVERSQSIGGPFILLSPNPTSTSFTDTTVTVGTAYLYRVRAVDASGNVSPYSNQDIATAISFTDDPLIINSSIIKAQHLTELRQAVNAVRLLAGLQPLSWTDPNPSGVAIKKLHIEELRTALDQALSALGLTAGSYTDPTLTTNTAIKRVHFEELRQRVK